MKKKVNAKLVMLEHSKAKVELYTSYLATYLTILARTPYVDTVHIYDLMCGEGIYSDGSKGSPIVTMEKIKEHYFQNNKTCPNLHIWFNDKDKSEIENDKYKVERVQQKCSKIYCPSNVNVSFRKEDYTQISLDVVYELESLSNKERALIFIDPYGYKEVKPDQLKRFLRNGKTEVILFLPISFMSRVANKSLSQDFFPGGKPLKEFLLPLFEFDKKFQYSTKPTIFINQLKYLLSKFLQDEKIFVDTFTIQRDEQNIYCLFFFTHHILGFEKMLETKWKLDEEQGKGFRLNSEQGMLFREVEISEYPNKLKNYILLEKAKTNADLYLFGLNNGFLPRHTNQVLKNWQHDNPKFKVYLKDGTEARKGAFYINYENYSKKTKQIVKFSFEK